MQDEIRILLVDDEQRNLDALEAILAHPDYRLLRAQDADKALYLLLQNDVAAIVLDIQMPGVSGIELAQLIKGTRKFRQIPIVFLTAYLVDDEDVLTGYGAGAVEYLTKPVNPKILQHKVAVFAELFRKTRALAELNDHLEARVKERTAELEKSEAALRTANQQKDAFLATLAHELRNPLAPLRTGLDLLMRTQAPMPSSTRTLAAMNRQLDHMVRLIDDLLDVSRINRGGIELKKERIELMSAIEGAIETARSAMDQRKQSLATRAAEPVFAFVDTTRVTQIIGNLLHNASKYTPEGGEIRVELERVDGRANIRVLDPGVGIPPDQLPSVFEMFAKIERATPNSNTGLGIGLALARQLAELHGGTLTAESEGDGRGATFTLSLPVSAAPEALPEPRVARTSASSAKALRVAVIEDNADGAEMLSTWLGQAGHEVRVASSGPDGLVLILDIRPDVVLCDVGLPGMDGLELCRRVRGAVSPGPVMVALTGWGMEADRERTQKAGFDHHLVKPVAPHVLATILEEVSARGA